MKQDATEIFVTIPTLRPEEPYRKVNLQQMSDGLFELLLNLHSQAQQNAQVAEAASQAISQWGGLTSELAEKVTTMQQTFDGISRELRGTAAAAKAVMCGRPSGKGMN